MPAAPDATRSSEVRGLQQDLDRIFGSDVLRRAQWAAVVQSLDTGDTLYYRHGSKLMMPASNMKVVTLAVAAERLGWQYRFETSLLATGTVHDGVLDGDLVVHGTGDPSIGEGDGGTAAVFDHWARQLRDAGVTRIAGRIVGDDSAFDDEGLGAGWAWDYLSYGYAAPTGALEYNESAVAVVVKPGTGEGDAATVSLEPPTELRLQNQVTTATKGEQPAIRLRRLPGSHVLEVEGAVPVGNPDLVMAASTGNPTDYFVRSLHRRLSANGIPVDGGAVDADDLTIRPDTSKARTLLVHQSAPLSEIAARLMKHSRNVYGDTLLKALGRREGVGSAETGRKVAAEILRSWGIGDDSYVMYDGSGLSRYNYVTADMLVAILRRMHEDPKHAVPFAETFPISATDGSLARRFQGTRAAGVVRAKTGSIANVRTLSGYAPTADGERLAFSILVNHFTAPQEAIDEVSDRAVERLVSFSRR